MYKVFFTIFQGALLRIKESWDNHFLCGTHCLDFIYISIKYREDIFKIVSERMNKETYNSLNDLLDQNLRIKR